MCHLCTSYQIYFHVSAVFKELLGEACDKREIKIKISIIRLFAYLIHIHLLETTLENFKILYVLVLQISLEFDSFQWYTARKEHIHKLTVDRTGAQFLDLGE